jgi:hypothetical protein
MVKTICIDDKNKPREIPANKWIKAGEEYHVIYTVTVLPQKQLAFHLHEVELDETCAPYEYFLSNRFMFAEEDIDALFKLVEDCCETDFSIDELLKQTKTIKSNEHQHSDRSYA